MRVLAVVLVSVLTLLMGGQTQAQAAPVTVAKGLANPRGLTFGPGGVLYVAEAGTGGAGPCLTGAGNQRFCLGATGAVTAVANGRQRRVVTGLPSLATEGLGEVFGPHDVAASGGGLLIPVGLGTDPARRAALGPAGSALAGLVRADSSGAWRRVADLGAYESTADPDGGQPGTTTDSQPYAVLAWRDGALVVDAGGNDVLHARRDGRIGAVAVFDTRQVPGPGGEVTMQPVPTAIAQGPDGAFYVGRLTGFPFPKGEAKVWRLVPGRAPEVYAGGFSAIADIAFDARGRLLVLEMFAEGLTSGDTTGALHRVARDGTRTLVARDGLVTPASVAVGPDGRYYVSNKATLPAGGEIVRIDP
ncbi:ScyD/ScyE family protein [Spongiactinospora sp. TRM90649]|uniref:ScyD/ScyE family protein n=1 Tax=Spongiactinospora sp. TRM90649 TaxID=3031114 RepID=UPI0023F9D6FF|nr:ScyD/ScyE family protein [Spongiactinospora sp. TRM90649]MDF5757093.1 ScyD/ScyE family protein [Spongiactinospora sp. TRM90649]